MFCFVLLENEPVALHILGKCSTLSYTDCHFLIDRRNSGMKSIRPAKGVQKAKWQGGCGMGIACSIGVPSEGQGLFLSNTYEGLKVTNEQTQRYEIWKSKRSSRQHHVVF